MLTAGPGKPGFVYFTCQVLNAEVSARQTHLKRYNFDEFLTALVSLDFYRHVIYKRLSLFLTGRIEMQRSVLTRAVRLVTVITAVLVSG